MTSHTVNVLLTTFPGIGLPSTLSLPISSSSTIGDLEQELLSHLPPSATNLTITTTSNKLLSSRRQEPINTLLTSNHDTILPLRLSAKLCGGKGGFGSQLRAAGGRMSSRKKKGVDTTGSMRNLDGRRLRTVTEAKALAEYLALKPEMDKREKEERRKRWEQVVKLAEDKQDEIKSGGGKGRVDGKWLEGKEEAAEKTRQAVLASLSAGEIGNLLAQGQAESDVSMEGSEDGENESESEEGEASAAVVSEKKSASARTFFGWDEDEDMSDSSEEEEEAVEEEDEAVKEPTPPPAPVINGKGKGKAKEVEESPQPAPVKKDRGRGKAKA
ncbi:hypothetical protein EJ08DRAFT_647482 [Tothia fuscella]|uniref:Sde2 N-terminal ubiquitin domain-containing protein n=1 Tax=Tothia fuscella TaxID=1048955 RepID=A0A9P4NWT2_9PEZI|nr:hypothetical protein EJ08DRAFT_647482 [Tothia fuscella]